VRRVIAGLIRNLLLFFVDLIAHDEIFCENLQIRLAFFRHFFHLSSFSGNDRLLTLSKAIAGNNRSIKTVYFKLLSIVWQSRCFHNRVLISFDLPAVAPQPDCRNLQSKPTTFGFFRVQFRS